jgi:hypothetical protein
MTSRNHEISITDPAIRKDFWEFLISRHPIEEDYALPNKNAYRWRHIPKLRLIVGQFVSQHGVGVYVRGEKGEKSTEVEHRLHPYAAKLKKAVGVEKVLYRFWKHALLLPQG